MFFNKNKTMKQIQDELEQQEIQFKKTLERKLRHRLGNPLFTELNVVVESAHSASFIHNGKRWYIIEEIITDDNGDVVFDLWVVTDNDKLNSGFIPVNTLANDLVDFLGKAMDGR